MRRLTAFAALIVLCWGSVAEAYVLPTEFLMRMLADQRRRQRIKDISIQLHTEEKDVDEPLDERLYLKVPERLRIVAQGEQGHLYVEREGVCATGTEQKLQRLKGPIRDLTATLLAPMGEDLEQQSARMVNALKQLGVDTKITSLGRFEGRPAYIIGARTWESQKPQVWLDKNSFLPVRLLVPEGPGKPLLETRLMGYGSPDTGNWFPRVIEKRRGPELIRRAEVRDIKVNQDLPETLFDLP